MKLKHFNRNTNILLILVVLFTVLCFAFIIKLSFFDKKKYTGEIYKQYPADSLNFLTPEERKNCVVISEVNPARGVIYDDMDKPLVSNVRVYPISIDGQSYNKNYKYFKKNEPYLDTLINDLARHFYSIFGQRYPEYSVQTYREKLSKALKEQKTVQIFREDQVVRENKWIFEEDLNKLKKLPLFCKTIPIDDRAHYGFTSAKGYTEKSKITFPSIIDVGQKKITIRLRPYGSMAQRILGNPTLKNGIDGCPQFNKILTGVAGINKKLIINNISIPLETQNAPIESGNVYTTINTKIQKIVHQELLKKAEAISPDWACAIVMETATGDIKAISNFTRVIQNGDTLYVESRNNAMVAETAEPGSTFKIASLLAYLERTNCDTTRKYPINIHCFTTRGGRKVTRQDSPLAAAKGEKIASIKEIIQRSSNVGIASMIREAFPNYNDYVRKLNEMYITLGFSAQIGKLSPINMKYDCKSFEDQYGCYFGAGFYMQPMQTLVYFNAIANNGKMMQPRFVRASEIEGKFTEYPSIVIKEQIASPQTIQIVQGILKAVVMERPGTAYRFHDLTFPFAGKTGTRDIYDRSKGQYDKDRSSVSFCGYFPADNPQYTCIVYMFNVQGHSDQAIEVFSKIAKQIMFPPSTIDRSHKSLYVANPVNHFQITSFARMVGISTPNIGKCDYAVSTSKDTTLFAPYSVTLSGNVPNVIGLSASDAIFELKKRGYKAVIHGIGIVTKQSFNSNNNTMTLILEAG